MRAVRDMPAVSAGHGVFHAAQVAYETSAIRGHLGALQAIRTGIDKALATAAQINAGAPKRPS
ncbi:hypothetical protein GCM10009574_074500 [Streptomyces asiaticus]|uniref:Uncharacterized protein n=3 Tax=Streptomyces TaxID=1883 RepID=A0ABN1S6G9_9ACTN